ncbi:MAG: DUF362 domain-containing protein, partial [Deltaproteobacteria bacterium]|nr:DUF362 domain-containing protein [Deltaproteobacteria bacterium]
TIGETDGGANAWKAEEAFEGHGLGSIRRAHGIRTMNLTRAERETVEVPVGRWKKVRVELPKILLRETDVFITIPVPKIHCMTKVSLGLKNQWGCIPYSEKRFTFHPHFDEMIWRLNRLFNPKIIVGDCTWMLTGSGPMFGEQIKTDMITVSNDIGSFELGMLHLMGLESWKISHIRAAKRNGMVPASMDEIEFNADWKRYRSDRFFLKRTLQNYIALAGFKSRFITWFGYESFLAQPLHDILYAIKGGDPLKKAVRERHGLQG